MCNFILSQFVPSRIQADLFKLKDNLQLPNHVCLWSQSSTLKVDVCPGLVCKLNSGTISKYLALNKFERKINSNSNLANNALCSKSNGSYDIKDFGPLSLIFSTSKYFRRKCQPCPSFFLHPNIPDKWKRAQLSLDQMKKKERVKVKS